MGSIFFCTEVENKPAPPDNHLLTEKMTSNIEEREARWNELVGRNTIVAKPQFSEKSREIVAKWTPRHTDVLIATPPKTGTTWLQQITHQLRSGGDMDFDDIYQVSPWQLMAYDVGLDINGEQPNHKTGSLALFPRTYKTHQRPSACPPGAKFLVTVRKPSDVWSSAYRFLKHKEIPPLREIDDMNDLKAFGPTIGDMAFGASLYDYYIEFWKLRNETNMLILCYEDLVKDTKRFIPLIAKFIGLSHPSDELITKVLNMSSKSFMAEHMEKFDESWCYKKLVEHGTHNRPEDFSKSNRVSKAVKVNEEVVNFLREKWKEIMTIGTGHNTWEQFQSDIRKLAEQRFEQFGLPTLDSNSQGDKLVLSEREDRWKNLVGKHTIVAKPQFSEKSREIVAAWQPRPTDILIATPPKTGTTWLQQLTHQLRTRGDMDFDDIYQVSPWQLMAYDVGLDINEEQPLHKPAGSCPAFFPRTFKSHQLPSACSSRAKFLVTVRSPPKVWSSAYRFLKHKEIPPLKDVNDMNDLRAYGPTVGDMAFGASLWDYYIEFWKLRFEKNILILCYEDFLQDTKRHIPLIAKFMGLPAPDEKLIATVLEMSSKDFMTKHMSKFDESWCYEQLIAHGTHNRPDDFSKSNRVSKAVNVDEKVEEFLKEKWDEIMIPATGHNNYADFANDIRNLTNQRFLDFGLPTSIKLQDDEKLYQVDSDVKEREIHWNNLVGRNKIVAKPQFSGKSREIVAAWVPRSTDILIATPPKTGTTWLQQITHQLRTGGDMDFDDIYQVSPWQLMAYDVGLDINGEQPCHRKNIKAFFPRTYKTHQLPSACSSAAKFLVTVRNPPKVWSSAYRFLKHKEIPPLQDIDDMNDLRAYGPTLGDMAFGASLYDYYVEFWKLQAEKNILIICYEELLKDTKRYIPLIAKFMELPMPDDKLIETVLEMSGKEFMRNHMTKFDESWCYKKLVEHGTHNRPEDFSKSNRVSEATKVNEKVEEFLQERWNELMFPATGHKNYDAFADDIIKVTERRFKEFGL